MCLFRVIDVYANFFDTPEFPSQETNRALHRNQNEEHASYFQIHQHEELESKQGMNTLLI